VSADQHRFVSADRRVREDRRFVAGKGRFVADIDLPNTKHVALLTCPHAAARIISIDKRAALAMPGVHYVLDGSELAAATLPLTVTELRSMELPTGSDEELTKLTRALGLVYARAPEANGDYTVDHSASAVIIDPQGRQAGLFRPPFDAAKIVADLKTLVASG